MLFYFNDPQRHVCFFLSAALQSARTRCSPASNDLQRCRRETLPERNGLTDPPKPPGASLYHTAGDATHDACCPSALPAAKGVSDWLNKPPWRGSWWMPCAAPVPRLQSNHMSTIACHYTSKRTAWRPSRACKPQGDSFNLRHGLRSSSTCSDRNCAIWRGGCVWRCISHASAIRRILHRLAHYRPKSKATGSTGTVRILKALRISSEDQGSEGLQQLHWLALTYKFSRCQTIYDKRQAAFSPQTLLARKAASQESPPLPRT